METTVAVDSETMPVPKMILLKQKLKEKTKEGLLWRLRKFEDKGFYLSKYLYFTMKSRRKEIVHELLRLYVLEEESNFSSTQASQASQSLIN